jgi:hypothetical protein
MKLSEAMMLGDGLRKRDYRTYLLPLHGGKWCGCAIGGATLAMGRTGRFAHRELWPWLNKLNISKRSWEIEIGLQGEISFKAVMRDECTFEQLVDYVRSIEPECGECNRFECSCSVPAEEKQLTHSSMSL